MSRPGSGWWPPAEVMAGPTPLPDLVPRDTGGQLSRGDVLYRLYLVALFGGLYGSALVQTLRTAVVAPPGDDQVLALGLAALGVPLLAVLVGVRFGRWAGPVAITRPEASLLLPTPIDRRELLGPRLRASLLMAIAIGSGVGLVATILLALSHQVGGLGWLVLPGLGATGALLAGGTSAVAQAQPWGARRHGQLTTGIAVVVVALGALAWTAPGRGIVDELGASAVGLGNARPQVLVWVAVVAVLAAVASRVGRARILGAHDEQLHARAGLHAGLTASVRLGDLRALALSRDPTARSRTRWRLPHPRRATGAILWRHLVALQARPALVVRCLAGWGLAAAMASTPPDVSLPAVILRVLVAAGALHVGTQPLLEPLRREHDTPLASELLPFGFRSLCWLHVRAALVTVTVIGYVGAGAVLAVTPGGLPAWALLLLAPLAAPTAVVTIADRVRQPENVADMMGTLPGGATPELMTALMLGRAVQPLVAMLPVALPLGLAMAAPLLPMPPMVAVALAAVVGVVILAVRVLGLGLWLREYELALQDADVLDASSSLTLAWRRLRPRPPES